MNTQKLVFSKLSEKKKVDLSLVGDIAQRVGELDYAIDNLSLVETDMKKTVAIVNNQITNMYDLIEDYEFHQENVMSEQNEARQLLSVLEEKANELGLSVEELIPDYSSIKDKLDFNAEDYSPSMAEAYDLKEKIGF